MRAGIVAKERTQSSDHLGGTVAIADRAPRGLARSSDIWRIGAQHSQTRAGVGNDARQGLIDFVRDRGGQRSKACDPGYSRKLGACVGEGFLRESALSHVLHRTDVLHVTVLVSCPMGN